VLLNTTPVKLIVALRLVAAVAELNRNPWFVNGPLGLVRPISVVLLSIVG
jgi:hypothetical protein